MINFGPPTKVRVIGADKPSGLRFHSWSGTDIRKMVDDDTCLGIKVFCREALEVVQPRSHVATLLNPRGERAQICLINCFWGASDAVDVWDDRRDEAPDTTWDVDDLHHDSRARHLPVPAPASEVRADNITAVRANAFG